MGGDDDVQSRQCPLCFEYREALRRGDLWPPCALPVLSFWTEPPAPLGTGLPVSPTSFIPDRIRPVALGIQLSSQEERPFPNGRLGGQIQLCARREPLTCLWTCPTRPSSRLLRGIPDAHPKGPQLLVSCAQPPLPSVLMGPIPLPLDQRGC